MVLKTLVETVLQSQREPHNLLHVQLLQTLKRDVAHDVTEAFTLSRPLVERYPDLYRASTSFVDFLFKLCGAPQAPTSTQAPTCSPTPTSIQAPPPLIPSQNLCNLQAQLELYKQENASLTEKLDTQKRNYDSQICAVRQETDRTLDVYKQSLDGLENSRVQFLEMTNKMNELLKKHPGGLFSGALPPSTTNLALTSSGLPVGSGDAALPPSTPNLALLPSQPVEIPDYDDFKAKLQEMLRSLEAKISENVVVPDANNLQLMVTDLKQTISNDLTVSNNYLKNFENLLKQNSPMETFYTKITQKLEEYMGRRLSKERLDEILEMFKIESYFADLKSHITPKGALLKATKSIDDTERKIKHHMKLIINDISKLCSNNLPYLPLLRRLDNLESSIVEKDTKLAQQTPKIQEYCKNHHSEFGYSDQWEEKLIEHIEELNKLRRAVADRIQQLDPNSPVMTNHDIITNLNGLITRFAEVHVHLQQTSSQITNIIGQMTTFMGSDTISDPNRIPEKFFDGLQHMKTALTNLENKLEIERLEPPSIAEVPSSPEDTPMTQTIECPITEAIEYPNNHKLYEQCALLVDSVQEDTFANDVREKFNLIQDREIQQLQSNFDNQMGRLRSKINQQQETIDLLQKDTVAKDAEEKCDQSEHEEIQQPKYKFQARRSTARINEFATQRLKRENSELKKEIYKLQRKRPILEKELKDKLQKKYDCLNTKYEALKKMYYPPFDGKCKRKCDYSVNNGTDKVTLDTLKTYFVALYAKYFGLLWGHWTIKDHTTEEILNQKLSILNTLTATSRPNELINVLTAYVDHDLHAVLRDETAKAELMNRVRPDDDRLLDRCIKETQNLFQPQPMDGNAG